MESKKKPFFFKFPHLKKPGKKSADKQGKKLAYRRSISFPDLRNLPNVAPGAPSGPSGSPGFASTPSHSDDDSIVSESTLSERRASAEVAPPAVRPSPSRDAVDHRVSAPAENWNHFDDTEFIRRRMNSSGKWSFHSEPGRAPKASVMELLPVPSPRHVSANQLITRLAALDGRENWDRSDTSSVGMSEVVSSALSRASSFGEQARGQASSPSVVRGSPSQGSQGREPVWAPLPDGFSDEERGPVTWNTDSEDQERELMSQYFTKLEGTPAEEEEEEEQEEENAVMDPEEVSGTAGGGGTLGFSHAVRSASPW